MAGDAVNIIDTGVADQSNAAVNVICQRINADDIECLEPPVDPPDDPEVTTTTTVATPTTVVQATTTTTVDPGTTTTTCPEEETTTTTAPKDNVTETPPLPPGFEPGMVLPMTC
jgi:hypothetical protein